jgi:hypothetical protein
MKGAALADEEYESKPIRYTFPLSCARVPRGSASGHVTAAPLKSAINSLFFEALRGSFLAHRERLRDRCEPLDRNVIDNSERALKMSVLDVSQALVERTKLAAWFLASSRRWTC